MLENLKVKCLRVKEHLCAKKIKTKKLVVDGVPLNSTTLGEVTNRAPLTSVDIEASITSETTPFEEFYGLSAVAQPFVGGPIPDTRYPLQTVSVQIEIDNDILKLEQLSLVGALGYYFPGGGFQIKLYNTTTRQWVLFEGDLTPFVINSVNWKSPTEKVVNIQSYATLTNQEICDVVAKQYELVPEGNPIPPPGNNVNAVQYFVFINGTLDDGPFEPLIRTQYSGTYTHTWLCN